MLNQESTVKIKLIISDLGQRLSGPIEQEQTDENFISRLKLDEGGGDEPDDDNDQAPLRTARSIIAQRGAIYASRIKQKADDDAKMLEKLQRLFKEIQKRSVIELESDEIDKIERRFATTPARNEDGGSGTGESGEGKSTLIFPLIQTQVGMRSIFCITQKIIYQRKISNKG